MIECAFKSGNLEFNSKQQSNSHQKMTQKWTVIWVKSEWGYIKKWIARLVKYIFFSFSSFHSVFGQKVPSETGQILIRNEEKMTRTWCIKVWNEQNLVKIWSNLIIFWWKSDSEKKSLISFCSDLTEIFTRVLDKFPYLSY